MAKKKKGKRHAHPVAPPVHSAPSGVQHSGPAGAQSSPVPPARPMGAEPPASETAVAAGRTEAPRRTRQTPGQRRSVQRRKQRRRNYAIAAVIVVLLIGGIVAQRVLSSRSSESFNKLASAAGCGKVESTGGSGSGEHLQPGEKTDYDTSPPTHGAHAASPLPEGLYDEPLSDVPTEDLNIYRAVHSLEHGAVIIWHDGLEESQVDDLDKRYRDERKVLVMPYPDLKGDHAVALTAWGRLAECERASTVYIDAFIDRYRESRDAPEPTAPLA